MMQCLKFVATKIRLALLGLIRRDQTNSSCAGAATVGISQSERYDVALLDMILTWGPDAPWPFSPTLTHATP